mgnify:CR=1 FL=1
MWQGRIAYIFGLRGADKVELSVHAALQGSHNLHCERAVTSWQLIRFATYLHIFLAVERDAGTSLSGTTRTSGSNTSRLCSQGKRKWGISIWNFKKSPLRTCEYRPQYRDSHCGFRGVASAVLRVVGGSWTEGKTTHWNHTRAPPPPRWRQDRHHWYQDREQRHRWRQGSGNGRYGTRWEWLHVGLGQCLHGGASWVKQAEVSLYLFLCSKMILLVLYLFTK